MDGHGQDGNGTDAAMRAVAARVREEIARRRISRQTLADKARISLSTLEKALAGTRPFTLTTVIRIEEALGLPLRTAAAVPASHDLAPESMGAYSRAAARWIEGRYLTLRPSFETPGGIYAYVVTLRWIEDAGHLGFSESRRTDARFEQAGFVSMPAQSGHIYLVTNEAGQYRMMVLGRPTIEGRLYGILTTLQVGKGSQLVPVSCPVALMRQADGAEPAIGLAMPGDPAHAGYQALLAAATAEDFVRFPATG